MWTEEIIIEGPYNFDFALNRLAMDPLHIVSLAKREIRMPIYLQKKEVATVKTIGTTEAPRFIVTGEHEQTKDNIINEVKRIFQWNKSLHTIHHHFSQTNLNELFIQHRGTPIVLDFALHANLYKAIIHQQITMSLAIEITADFVRTYGEVIDGVPFYPDPETIAHLQIEDLTRL